MGACSTREVTEKRNAITSRGLRGALEFHAIHEFSPFIGSIQQEAPEFNTILSTPVQNGAIPAGSSRRHRNRHTLYLCGIKSRLSAPTHWIQQVAAAFGSSLYQAVRLILSKTSGFCRLFWAKYAALGTIRSAVRAESPN